MTPFWSGVIATILVEIILSLGLAYLLGKEKNKHE